MIRKSFAVFGLGKFGYSIAETLADAGCEVMAVDIDDEKIQSIADSVTYAMRADITEQGVLESLGISNIDVAIIALSENMEASIIATIFAKEAGVSYVLAKATNQLHGQILRKVGADDVVFPEWAMGARVAKNLVSGGFLDFFELSSKFSMAELAVPQEWDGKTLVELDLRNRFKINVIGIMSGDEVEVHINPDAPLKEGETLMLVGDNESLVKFHQ